MSAIGVCVIGPSGVGKSTSMMNLDPKSTYVINVQGKALPFPKGKEYKRVDKAQDTKQFKTIIKGMTWVETYIDTKLNLED